MSEASIEPSLAFLSDPEGRVLRVLRDDVSAGGALHPGRWLLEIVESESREKARNFLSALTADGAALDWPLLFCRSNQDPPQLLYTAGLAVAGGGFLVVGARTFAAAARLLSALAPHNGPDIRGLSAGLREWSRWAGERGQKDGDLYDELSRLNNELITAQRELAKQHAELARLNAEKNQFLGIAAHDLRNPLAIILAYSEALREDRGAALDPRKIRSVDAICRSSELMLDLIDDLLDVAKIEAGKLVLNRTPTNLNRLVRRNVALNRALAERQQVRLTYAAKVRCPELLLDQRKIEQVLNNVVGNALKVSPPGGTVSVELRRDPEGALIRVRDRGPGIPRDELEVIFRPFQQGRLGTLAGGKSAGLGLAIASSIVRGHGGRLWAESSPPDGASFFVLLPLSLAAGEPELPASCRERNA